MWKSACAALALIVAAVPVATLANTSYKCKIVQHAANGNSLPPTVYVERIGNSREAQVMDGFIKNYLGSPAKAVVQTDNAKRITFSWTLDATDGSGDLTRMSFHLTYMKATHSATVFVEWLGYLNQYTSTGTCTVK